MPLPDLIEIVPLEKPVQAEITVPGSKSITNRALVLAALSEGETTLEGALWSEDTQVMVECLQELGFMVNVAADRQEPCNRTITVYGKGGVVPPGGTEAQPLELFVGNAGTAARFLAAMVCLGKGVYLLHGVPRMHERPQAALFRALRELGYQIESAGERLPAVIRGGGPRAERCQVSIEESSQFASALLLCASFGQWQVTVSGENEEESPYVAMTRKLVAVFPRGGGRFQIEPDASSGSYFWAAERFVQRPLDLGTAKSKSPMAEPLDTIRVARWPRSGWQIDDRFPGVLLLTTPLHAGLERMRGWKRFDEEPLKPLRSFREEFVKRGEISRRDHLGDSIMTAIVMAPFSLEPIRFIDLGRLRGAGRLRGRLLLALLGRLEEGVLGDLRLDEVDQLHPRQLEELDRLLQLGGHHQLLRHPEVLFQLERHSVLP